MFKTSFIEKFSILVWFIYAISIYFCSYKKNGTKFLKFYFIVVAISIVSIASRRDVSMMFETLQLLPWIYVNWRLFRAINIDKRKELLS